MGTRCRVSRKGAQTASEGAHSSTTVELPSPLNPRPSTGPKRPHLLLRAFHFLPVPCHHARYWAFTMGLPTREPSSQQVRYHVIRDGRRAHVLSRTVRLKDGASHLTTLDLTRCRSRSWPTAARTHLLESLLVRLMLPVCLQVHP